MDQHRGHAAHFLTRIDRLGSEHAELALGLYRDAGLVKYLLSRVHLPDSADRVALCLDDPGDGPFLVVTRDGNFVTCLGKGMHLREALPLITRHKLDQLSEEVSELRRLMRESASGQDTNTRHLLQRVLSSGPQLSRQEFDDLCAWGPMLGGVYVEGLMLANGEAIQAYNLLRAQKRGAHRCDAGLQRYWEASWATHHFLGLVGTEKTGIERLQERALARNDPTGIRILIQDPADSFVRPIVLRAAWLAAKLPKIFFGALKAGYDALNSLNGLYACGLGLVCIGIRHRRYRAEIRKFLSRPPAHPYWRSTEVAKALTKLFPECLDDAIIEAAGPILDLEADKQFEWFADHCPPAHRAVYLALPHDVRLPLTFNHPEQLIGSKDELLTALRWLPRVAQGEARDFYLPKPYHEYVPADRHDEALKFYEVRRDADTIRNRRPHVAPKLPGRNDPCSCGSNKKYKRCCGQSSAG